MNSGKKAGVHFFMVIKLELDGQSIVISISSHYQSANIYYSFHCFI